MRSMQDFREVAPSLLVSRQRCSSCPKLETILEEGSERFEILPKTKTMVIIRKQKNNEDQIIKK